MRAFERRFGLVAVAGGRHPGAGTANAIVEVGARQYLELIAVVDAAEAASVPRSRRVTDAVAAGETFATWALRVDDLEEARSVLDAAAEVRPGARDRPDGTRLEWRSLELGDADAGSGVPFLISWGGSAHPGAGGGGRVLRVRLEDSAAGPLRALLDRVDLDVPYQLDDGPRPRLVQVELEAGERRLAIG